MFCGSFFLFQGLRFELGLGLGLVLEIFDKMFSSNTRSVKLLLMPKKVKMIPIALSAYGKKK